MRDLDSEVKKARNLINDHCIVRVPKGSKELPALGGETYYSWQFYLRTALFDSACLQVICDDFWQKFEQLYRKHPFQVAGVEAASVPIITALIVDAAKRGYRLNAFTIRKERKSYGKRNLIEGTPTSEPVLFVDDLTSSHHNAFWHAIHAISLAGLTLNGCGYVVVLKQNSSESRSIQTSLGNVVIESLFTLANFSLSLEDYNAEKMIEIAMQQWHPIK